MLKVDYIDTFKRNFGSLINLILRTFTYFYWKPRKKLIKAIIFAVFQHIYFYYNIGLFPKEIFIQDLNLNGLESLPSSPPRRMNSQRRTSTSYSQMLNGACAEDNQSYAPPDYY